MSLLQRRPMIVIAVERFVKMYVYDFSYLSALTSLDVYPNEGCSVHQKTLQLSLVVLLGSVAVLARPHILTIMDQAMAALPFMSFKG